MGHITIDYSWWQSFYLKMHSGISLNWFSDSHSEISDRFPNSSGNVFNSLLLFTIWKSFWSIFDPDFFSNDSWDWLYQDVDCKIQLVQFLFDSLSPRTILYLATRWHVGVPWLYSWWYQAIRVSEILLMEILQVGFLINQSPLNSDIFQSTLE